MPSAEYFQKQAEICLKLALTANSPKITSRLISMAADYKHKAIAVQQGVTCGETGSAIVDLIVRSRIAPHAD